MKTPLTNPKFKRTVDVINSIEQDIQLEKGIVPLIGAGMSAHSGIPAGVDYFSYLFYCLTRVIGIDTNGKSLEQWDPSTLRWPDYLEMPAYKDFDKEKLNWCNKIMAKINRIESLNEKHKKGDKTIVPDYESTYLYTQALGVVSDWRSTLDLLSRMKLSDKTKKNTRRKIILKQPDERLIDSFFVNLTKGKKPNSSHMLLAHISDILRIKTILTTNFDSLIENAYQKLINPIAVFDVHLDARLPDADFVRAQRSVVKMHGGRYGLRADFSLDKAPLKDDVEQFINYLSFYKPKEERNKLKTQRNLLVMGVSPSSKRVMDLMCHALARLQNLKIYWICYKEDDRKKVWESFRNTIEILNKNGEIDESFYEDWKNSEQKYLDDRLFITSAHDLTTFLLEVYQQVFLSLPPAGVQFSSVWPFPAKPWVTKINNYNNYKNDLKKKLQTQGISNNIIYISGANGISALAADVFYEVTSKYNCFWFNLNEIYHKVDFIYTLIDSIANRIGYYDLTPANLILRNNGISENVKNQYQRIVKYHKRPIIVFINYREVFYDNNDSAKNTKIDFNTLELIKLLKDLKNENVTFVILGHPNKIDFIGIDNINIKEDIAKKFNSNGLFENIKKLSTLSVDIHRFLLSLSLVRNISYLSLLHTWSFLKAPDPLISGHERKDNDKNRFDIVKRLLDEINKYELFRNDDNHFVYVPFNNREVLQNKLREYFTNTNEDYFFYKAESHQGIADWYMKLYRSSGDIHAMTESIFHRFQCMTSALNININIENIAGNQERLITTSLIEMDQAIKLSKNTLFTSFQLLSISRSLILFCREDLKKFIDKLKITEYSSIKNIAWYIGKLENIKKDLNYLHHEFARKMGNEFSEIKLREINSINPKNLNELYNDLQDQSLLSIRKGIKTRNYKIAMQQIKDRYIEFNFTRIYDLQNTSEKRITEHIREKLRTWIYENIGDNNINDAGQFECALEKSQPLFKSMIRLFRYHHWLLLLDSQVDRYITTENNKIEKEIEHNDKLRNAEIIYICSTEMMRYISDKDFINRENAKLRTNTGIMLSWMKRHHEAYRRYNEAYGYLNFGNKADMPMEFSIIDLRRAETFISKIEQKLFKKSEENKNEKNDPLSSELRIHFGYLYDAIASADRGESRMKGNSISIWWRCWTIELQMLICTKIKKLRNQICDELKYPPQDKYDLFGHCRECEMCGQRFIKNLEKGLEIVGDDLLRLARYLELTKQFADSSLTVTLAERFRESQQQGKTALLTLITKSKKVELDTNVKEYVTVVLNKTNANSL